MSWQQLAAYVFYAELTRHEAEGVATKCADVLLPVWRAASLDPYDALRRAVEIIYSDSQSAEAQRLARWVLITCAQEADEIELKTAA